MEKKEKRKKLWESLLTNEVKRLLTCMSNKQTRERIRKKYLNDETLYGSLLAAVAA